jgi:hypothetical protein
MLGTPLKNSESVKKPFKSPFESSNFNKETNKTNNETLKQDREILAHSPLSTRFAFKY